MTREVLLNYTNLGTSELVPSSSVDELRAKAQSYFGENRKTLLLCYPSAEELGVRNNTSSEVFAYSLEPIITEISEYADKDLVCRGIDLVLAHGRQYFNYLDQQINALETSARASVICSGKLLTQINEIRRVENECISALDNVRVDNSTVLVCLNCLNRVLKLMTILQFRGKNEIYTPLKALKSSLKSMNSNTSLFLRGVLLIERLMRSSGDLDKSTEIERQNKWIAHYFGGDIREKVAKVSHGLEWLSSPGAPSTSTTSSIMATDDQSTESIEAYIDLLRDKNLNNIASELDAEFERCKETIANAKSTSSIFERSSKMDLNSNSFSRNSDSPKKKASFMSLNSSQTLETSINERIIAARAEAKAELTISKLQEELAAARQTIDAISQKLEVNSEKSEILGKIDELRGSHIELGSIKQKFSQELTNIKNASRVKLAFASFNVNDLVLFVPRAFAQWVAFNANAPNYYLDPMTARKLGKKSFAVGRITSIEDHMVTPNNTGRASNPFNLPLGTQWHLVHVKLV